ncbi:MAG: hypothetical protein JJLCMIEE_00870 [Acidimicrobiales bacterium]|nr:hypothetical protein [Acidimicrobiales bacterium]
MPDRSAAPEPGGQRLPATVIPRHYRLQFEPDLEQARFEGSESVDVEVTEAVREMVLNSLGLEIRAVSVVNPAGERIRATTFMDEANERATFRFSRTLDPGRWRLECSFSGDLNERLEGFYRSTFTDHEGVERTLAATQFEATHARRAFPCWDEPALKATFGVTLVVSEELTAISNTREIASEAAGDGRRRVTFADSMRMSTYLVAFVVGPLEATDPTLVDGTPVRIVHPLGKGHLAAYPLEVAAFALRFLTDYYGIAYPGDKLDLVAVPDFAFGAMENLGCVTFREVLLLVDPESVTQPELQNVADVIGHELAHMWFGDLVTMNWWNGIWLNEAFATFMEMKTTDAFRPDWQRWVDFGLSRTAAFDVDSLVSTRPVEYPVTSPEEAEGMFDVLTYEKGAAVVRMLEEYIGEQPFREGIRRYLEDNAYANTETTDLWDALEAVTGEPTRRIMDSWILQGGYPVVDVEWDERSLRLSQHRFQFEAGDAPSGGEQNGRGPTWNIPAVITVGVKGGSEELRALLVGGTTRLDLPPHTTWVQLNRGAGGFYRVRYGAKALDALLERGAPDPIDRYGLLDDAWAMLLAGRSTMAAFIALLRRFGDETDLVVWRRLIAAMHALDRLAADDPTDAAAGFVREMAQGRFRRLDEEIGPGSPDRARELRGALFNLLGTIGRDPDVAARAREILWEDVGGGADPSLVAASVDVVAATGGRPEYDELAERWRHSSTPQEEIRYLYALADFDHPDLLDRTLALAVTEVRSQNGPYLVRRALGNRNHGQRAWDFVEREWDRLNQRFPSNSIVRMLEGVRSLSRPEEAGKVLRFFETHSVPQGAVTLAQHLERLRVNVAFRQRESGGLVRLLEG